MSEFERENRYIVIKQEDLNKLQGPTVDQFRQLMPKVLTRMQHRRFLVIESDWPEYEPVWAMIKARMTGSAPPQPDHSAQPDYMQAVCDKFDWTPEEALAFYAEGKNFDVVAGRTRILETGAVASYALKNMGGEYSDMKGAQPLGTVQGDVQVNWQAVAKEQMGIIDAHKQRLATAEQLLRNGRAVVRGSEYKVSGGIAWLYGVDNFLSSSAKPEGGE